MIYRIIIGKAVRSTFRTGKFITSTRVINNSFLPRDFTGPCPSINIIRKMDEIAMGLSEIT
jgi:hypothetical protein